MNIKEAHREFRLFVDKVDSQATPDFLSKEIDVFIHEAELRLVNLSYGRNNVYQKGFQEIQKRTDDLNSLVKVGYLELTEITGEYAKFKLDKIYKSVAMEDFTEDYLYYLGCTVFVFNDRNGKYVQPELVSLDDLEPARRDPFRGSIATPLISFADDSIYVHLKDFKADRIKLTYLKYPKKINYQEDISSELPEHKQREAIQLAVRIALGVTENPRVNEQNEQLNSLE